jgi:dTDP-4-dehydrorhamnose 3,5-epimerase
MKVEKLPLEGALRIELAPSGDARGYFMRTFCARELAPFGVNATLAQASQSFTREAGTLRGLHFQGHPAMEDKLVRCARGAVFDVIVDLRPGSPSFGRWMGLELSEENFAQVYVPKGFAHGFQTLRDDCVLLYQISQFYEPERTGGLRFDDPDIGVAWPLEPKNLSARDLAAPLLRDVDRDHLLPFTAGDHAP